MYTVLNDEDYDRQIIPLFSRIFDSDLWCWFDQAFMNETWGAVLIPEEIRLAGAEIDEENDDAYLTETIKIYRNIVKIIDEIASDTVYVANMSFTSPSLERGDRDGHFGATVRVRPFIRNFNALKKSEINLGPWFAICDDTETWGYANHIDRFSFLGGTPEFMERFYDLCGGRDVVRQTFHAFDISTVWPFSFEYGAEPAWPRSYEDRDAPATETLRERAYHSVGWEATPYTEEEILNSYSPLDERSPYYKKP